jgi:hypothetical protein
MRDGLNSPYINPRDERLYREDSELSSGFQREEGYKERVIVEKEIVEKQAKRWQKIKEERLRSLRLLGGELIGNIFERVKFLEDRINDTQSALKSRLRINKQSINEISEDIDQKLSELNTINDPEMMRDLRLDLTNLKMERRRETLLFWKDTLELQRELQQLKEQLAIESKVAELFEGLREDGV